MMMMSRFKSVALEVEDQSLKQPWV